MHEQRRLEAGEAAVDLSHRGVLTVTGPDRLSWLNSLTSQSLLDCAPGEAREALVLTPHGHVEHDLHLVDDGSTVWITVEPGTAPALHDWLDRMRFMLRVEVADVTAAMGGGGRGPRARRAAAGPRHGAPAVWVDPWPALGADQRLVRRRSTRPRTPAASGAFAEVLAARATRARRGAGGVRAPGRHLGGRGAPGRGLAAAARASRPTTGRSRTRSTGCAPPSTCRRGATAGRRPSPGCTTSAGRRAGWCSCTSTARSTPCRRTATRCVNGDRQVGFVTTAARHHELGPVALALVKRSPPVDAPLTAGGVPAAQEVVGRALIGR